MTNKSKGFTLIELLISLLIAGILIGAALPFISALRESGQIEETEEDLKAIREILISYYRENFSLPDAAAPPTGSMALPSGCSPPACGALPINTLGLSDASQRDAFYNNSIYLYSLRNRGESDLSVDGNSIGNPSAVVVSRGKNLKFEGENDAPDDGEFTRNGTSTGFDDLLISISGAEIHSVSGEDGIVSSLDALVRIVSSLSPDLPDGMTCSSDDHYPHNRKCMEDAEDPLSGGGGVEYLAMTVTYNSTDPEVTYTDGGVIQPFQKYDMWGRLIRLDADTNKFFSTGPDGESGTGDDFVSQISYPKS